MRAWAVVLVGAVAALLCGCAGGPQARPVATPIAALGCAQEVAGPVAGGVPGDFTPDAAYLCDRVATQDDAEGTWSGTRLTRYEGDLAPLLKTLAVPDEPAWGGACPAIGFAGPELWLGDATGSYVHVAYPVNGCGMPQTDAVFAALDALTVVDEHFERSRLVDSAAARRSGCPSVPDPLVRIGHPAGAMPDLPAPDGLVACRYESAPPASDAPDASVSSPAFAGAAVLDARAARALLAAAASGAPAPAACSQPASRYVVVVPATRPARGDQVTIELDGCRRLIDRAHSAFHAPDALLAQLERR